jgi:mevalonate kinase
MANFNAIIEKGKKLYPESEYWVSMQLENMRKNSDQAQMFAKYEEMIAQNPTNYVVPYNYSIELFNSIYGKDAKPADEMAAKDKLTAALKKAIANDKGKDATILMTKHLYNKSSDMSIAATLVKGTKPEDVKKRAELVEKTKAQMDEFLEYAKQGVAYYESLPSLKPVQRATYQELLTNMSEIYNYKKDTKSAAEIDKKKAAL